MVKVKRPAAARRRREGKTGVDPQSEEDLADTKISLDPEDEDDAHDGIGTPPFEGASGNGRGSTDAPWLSGGGGNARQAPKPAVVGQEVEGSYNPRARPASATRKAFDAAVERRVAKFMARNPSASRIEATAWATKGRKVQRLLEAS